MQWELLPRLDDQLTIPPLHHRFSPVGSALWRVLLSSSPPPTLNLRSNLGAIFCSQLKAATNHPSKILRTWSTIGIWQSTLLSRGGTTTIVATEKTIPMLWYTSFRHDLVLPSKILSTPNAWQMSSTQELRWALHQNCLFFFFSSESSDQSI